VKRAGGGEFYISEKSGSGDFKDGIVGSESLADCGEVNSYAGWRRGTGV
jgi:hypothetical protein